jgi:ketosteroid isomerase-like protein
VKGATGVALGAAAICLSLAAGLAFADATSVPLARQVLPASSEECAVWRRERSFAQSVEAHDAVAFASHLQAGVVFNAGTLQADRGRDVVTKSWATFLEGKNIVLRWRPGIVSIGSDPRVAFSRGPYILQTIKDNEASFGVGFYQTIWTRDADGTWRALFDSGASSLTRVDDRKAADDWVAAQAMSDCANGAK